MVRFPKLLTRMLQLLLLAFYISMTLATDETMDPNKFMESFEIHDFGNLKMGHVNACGLHANSLTNPTNTCRIDEILDKMVKENILLMSISETHMKDERTPEMYYPYIWLGKNRAQSWGGAGLIIHSFLNHKDLTKEHFIETRLECSIIQFLWNNFKCCFASVYLPNSTKSPVSKSEELDLFEKLCFDIDNLGFDYIFLVGDFNAEHFAWGSNRGNTRGNKIVSQISALGYFFHKLSEPTRLGKGENQQDSYIDFFITKPQKILSPTLIGALLSDHKFITSTFETQPLESKFEINNLKKLYFFSNIMLPKIKHIRENFRCWEKHYQSMLFMKPKLDSKVIDGELVTQEEMYSRKEYFKEAFNKIQLKLKTQFDFIPTLNDKKFSKILVKLSTEKNLTRQSEKLEIKRNNIVNQEMKKETYQSEFLKPQFNFIQTLNDKEFSKFWVEISTGKNLSQQAEKFEIQKKNILNQEKNKFVNIRNKNKFKVPTWFENEQRQKISNKNNIEEFEHMLDENNKFESIKNIVNENDFKMPEWVEQKQRQKILNQNNIKEFEHMLDENNKFESIENENNIVNENDFKMPEWVENKQRQNMYIPNQNIIKFEPMLYEDTKFEFFENENNIGNENDFKVTEGFENEQRQNIPNENDMEEFENSFEQKLKLKNFFEQKLKLKK